MGTVYQKKLGAYYTPPRVAECLSRWAIRSKNDIVLEPSFGGCNFLLSSCKVLVAFGQEKPYAMMHGFDVDKSAFHILDVYGISADNFHCADFLLQPNTCISTPVDAVVGNPPYLAAHKMEKSYSELIRKNFRKGLIRVGQRASLWAYFIVHSIKFLKRGGRLSFVLPDSLVFTDYGKGVLKQISGLFTSIQLLRIEERFFEAEGTKEKTLFFLCDGYLEGSCEPQEYHCNGLEEALAILPNLRNIHESIDVRLQKHESLDNNAFGMKTLGDLFDIKIGIVIGDTKRLTYSLEKAETSPMYPGYMYPIVTKGKQLNGIVVNTDTLRQNSSSMPCMVVDGVSMEMGNPDLYSRLLTNLPDDTLNNVTFKNRKHPFGYDDFNHPDAFLTFYSQGLPKVVLNERRELNSTNSVHRLYCKEGTDLYTLMFVAIQMYSEFFHDDINKMARKYGNLIRKFEPSDAKKIPVVIPMFCDLSIYNRMRAIISEISCCSDQVGREQLKSDINSWIRGIISSRD